MDCNRDLIYYNPITRTLDQQWVPWSTDHITPIAWTSITTHCNIYSTRTQQYYCSPNRSLEATVYEPRVDTYHTVHPTPLIQHSTVYISGVHVSSVQFPFHVNFLTRVQRHKEHVAFFKNSTSIHNIGLSPGVGWLSHDQNRLSHEISTHWLPCSSRISVPPGEPMEPGHLPRKRNNRRTALYVKVGGKQWYVCAHNIACDLAIISGCCFLYTNRKLWPHNNHPLAKFKTAVLVWLPLTVGLVNYTINCAITCPPPLAKCSLKGTLPASTQYQRYSRKWKVCGDFLMSHSHLPIIFTS